MSVGILFSTVFRAAVAAKSVILGILHSISVILGLQSATLTSSLASGIFLLALSIFISNLIYQCYIEFLKEIHQYQWR